MLGGDMAKMLRCIRCGACMNHCPVYSVIGGHPYGSTYPGPMGSILTPALNSLEQAGDLPNACTLNGRCREVCPVDIPLPDMMRALRERQWREKTGNQRTRWIMTAWAYFALHPWLYRLAIKLILPALRLFKGTNNRLKHAPLARSWTKDRDLPLPGKRSFIDQWHSGKTN
jgi:L-lactate dehydrogenase complex protein LldF